MKRAIMFCVFAIAAMLLWSCAAADVGIAVTMSDDTVREISAAFGDAVTVALPEAYGITAGELAGGGYHIRVSGGHAVIAAADSDGADAAAVRLLSQFRDVASLTEADFTITVSGGEKTLAVDPAISSHMVLRRESDIKICGNAAPGERVYASIRGEDFYENAVSFTDSSGNFTLAFPPMAADAHGKSICIGTEGGACARFDDVLVGDVWLITGQSNAGRELYRSMNFYGETEYPVRADMPVRLYYQSPACSEAAKGGVGPIGDGWSVCTEAALDRFSAVGAYFAEAYFAGAGVPVGLIESAANGAALSELLPADAAAEFGISGVNVPAGAYYDLLLAPFGNTAITGVIVYQGESEAGMRGYYERYAEQFCRFVGALRDLFSDPSLPVIEVQLTTYGPAGAQLWPELQEIRQAELDAALRMENVYIVPTVDCGAVPSDEEPVHPCNKRPVGVRAAGIAFSSVLGLGLFDCAEAPYPVHVTYAGGKIVITYENVGGGLTLDGGSSPGGFTVMYADGTGGAPKGTAIVSENTVEIECDAEKIPVRVLYGDAVYRTPGTMNLVNTAGVPSVAFTVAVDVFGR